MPKKRRGSITGDSERRRRAENQRQRRENERLRREKEDAAEKQRRFNAEYYRRRKEILNQMEAEKQSRLAENRRKEIQNQIEAEKQSQLAENRRRLAAERYRAACSEKKEDVSKWQQIPEGIHVEGRRIVDFQYFFKAIKDVNNHSKAGCNLNDIFIKRESMHGICTSYCLKCAVCNFEKDIWSENPSAKGKNLNMEFLSGIMSIKCSFKDANALLSKMRLPFFCEKNAYVPFTALDSNKTSQNTPQNLRENVQTESQLTAVEQCSSVSVNSSLLERIDLSGLIVEDKFEIEEENVIVNINESETVIPDQRVRTSDDKLIAGQKQVITHSNKTCQNISKNLVENGQNIIENKNETENIILGQRVRTSDDILIADQEQVINMTTIKQEINSDDKDMTSSVTNETKSKESKIDNYEQSVFRAVPILSQQNEEGSCEKRMIVNQGQINLQLIASQEQVITHNSKACQNIPKISGENVQRESQLTAVEQCSPASRNSSLLERIDLGGLIIEDQFEIKEENVIEDINKYESVILDPSMRTSDDKLIAGQEQVITHSNKTCHNIPKNLGENVHREKQCSPASGNGSLLERIDLGGLIVEDQFEIKEENVIENLNESESIILGPRMGTSDDKLIDGQEQAILNMTTIKKEINSDDEDLTSSVTNETKSKESKIDNYEQSVFRTVPILSQQNEEVACEKRMIVNQGQINLQNIIENKNEPENIILGQKVRTSVDKWIADQEQVILNMTTIKQEINSDDEDLTSSVTNETKSKESRIDNYEQSVLVPILSQQNEERAWEKRMIVNQEQINLHKNVVVINNQVNNILVKPDVNTMEIIDIDSVTDFHYKPESELPRKKTRTEIYKDLYNSANMQKGSRTLKKGINIFQNRLDSNGFVTATSITTGRGNLTSSSSITSGENLTATSSITTRGRDITSLIPVQHSPKCNESSALIVPQMPHNIARETNQGLSGTASISGVPSSIQQPANASGATCERLASTVVKQPVNLSNSLPGAIPAANSQSTSLSNVVSNASGSNICAQQPVKSSSSTSRVIPATNIVQNANRNKMCILQPVKSFSNIPRVKTVTNIARKANTRKINVLQRVKSPNSIPRVKPATKIVKYANGTTYAVL